MFRRRTSWWGWFAGSAAIAILLAGCGGEGGSTPAPISPTPGDSGGPPSVATSLEDIAVGLGALNGIAIASNGDFLVSDYSTGTYYRVHNDGSAEVLYETAAYATRPVADSAGHIYLLDRGAADIVRLDPDGSGAIELTTGTSNGLLGISGSDQLYWFNDTAIHTVSTFNGSMTTWGSATNPYEMAWLGGSVLIPSHSSGTVSILDASTGAYTGSIGGFKQFGPTGIAIDAGGCVYVTNPIDATLWRYGPGGLVALATGFTGKSNPPYIGPTDVVIRDGRLYVTDSGRIVHVVVDLCRK